MHRDYSTTKACRYIFLWRQSRDKDKQKVQCVLTLQLIKIQTRNDRSLHHAGRILLAMIRLSGLYVEEA